VSRSKFGAKIKLTGNPEVSSFYSQSETIIQNFAIDASRRLQFDFEIVIGHIFSSDLEKRIIFCLPLGH